MASAYLLRPCRTIEQARIDAGQTVEIKMEHKADNVKEVTGDQIGFYLTGLLTLMIIFGSLACLAVG